MSKVFLHKKPRVDVLKPNNYSTAKNIKYPLKKDIVVEGIWEPCDGYGASTQNILLGLNQIVNVGFYPRWKGPTADTLSDPLIKTLISEQFICNNYLIYYSASSDLMNGCPKGMNAKRFLLTMFEANSPPLTWFDRIHEKFHRLIVPCNFNKEVLLANNWYIPINVIPLGIRTDIYRSYQRSYPKDRPFRFLTSFANHALLDDRKNCLTVLEAFTKKYGSNKDFELVLKISGEIQDHIVNYLPPNIKIYKGKISYAALNTLYKQVDCYISASKGEGYDMPVREAMATSLPCIFPNFGALTDLADEDASYPINDYKLIPAMYPDNEAQRHNRSNRLFGKWAYINEGELIHQMESVVEDYSLAIKKGKIASSYIHDYESYLTTGKKIAKLFELV